MINLTNYKKKVLICYLPFLALLLSLCVPVLTLNAANRSIDKIKPGNTLVEGDSITSKNAVKITATYYLASGPVTEISENGTLTIIQRSDQPTGTVYKRYTVNSITLSENNIEISLTGIPVPASRLVELLIKTPPSKTSYLEGEAFDPKGMVITACYSDGKWEDITDIADCKISPSGALSANVTSVAISYTDNGNVTQKVNQKITVNAKTPDSYTISANAAAGGSISDAGGSWIKRGDSKTYTISPNNGYKINYVEVDGSNVGAVSSYTFNDIQADHTINAYFMTGGNTGKKLTVVGSFAAASGAGSYPPGTKVTVDAGFVPGFTFAGWIASDGIIYPLSTMSYVMPGYDIILYANWIQSGISNTLSPITTTNLKGQQLTGWIDITNKLAAFNTNDLNQPGSPVMKVTVGGSSCYVDPAPIAMLNTRQGIALDISYGADASFTFYSDLDNAQFSGTDLGYTCSTSTNFFFHEKSLVFMQPGPINTGICLNLSLPDAQPGQTAYVYLANKDGSEIMYLPAIVNPEKKITIPISAKVNLNIKY